MENKKHYAVVDDYKRKLTLKFKDKVIVSSKNARILKEVAQTVYNPVFYFPKEDVKVKLIKENNRKSHCPIKGDATYWVMSDEAMDDYFAWSYEEPLSAAEDIKGFIAFNMSQLSLVSEPI